MIILVTGKCGVGKDTAGRYLVSHYGFKQDSLAAPIKRLTSDIFCIPHHVLNPTSESERFQRECELALWPGWTPRKLLQFIGTEMFRENIMEDVWVRSLWLRMQCEPNINWCISDVRFPNEQSFLKENCEGDVITIRVLRDGYNGQTHGGIQSHVSEAHNLHFDYSITNNTSFDELYAQIDGIASDLELTPVGGVGVQ